MGFYLTLFYLAFMIASPASLFPQLAPYRMQWVMGGMAALATAAMLPINGYPVRSRQTLIMAALFMHVPLTRLFGGWIGGAVFAVAEFGSTAVVFFLLVAARPKLSRLRAIAITLALPAFYAGVRGMLALGWGWERAVYVLDQNVWEGYVVLSVVPRMRFVGQFADPNDLAQYFLIVIPFVALLWKPKSVLRNYLIVLPMISFLLVSIYLTHSRGALLGLVVVATVYFGRFFNRVVMILGSTAMVVGLLAINFSGGRAVNFGAGSDRIEAWGAGLGMLRSHPIFGVGYNLFGDHNPITAHNSFVLCFAELGLVGFFLWLGILSSTMLGVTQLNKRLKGVAGAADLVRWATAIQIALVGFIATGWFLSRTYVVLLYVLVAMWVILDQVAAAHPAMAPAGAAGAVPVQTAARPYGPRVQGKKPWHWVPVTVSVQLSCLLLIWLMVRARWS